MKKFLIVLIIIIFSFLVMICNKSRNVILMSKYTPFYGEYENFDNMKLYNNLPKIDVATAFYPVASSIVQNIYDEKSYNNELSYVSTSTAYNDLLSKKVDVIIVTKPSKNQKEMIEKFNEDLKFIPIAREALVFYTRKENTIKSFQLII